MTYDEWRESYFSGQLMNEAMARAAWDFAVLAEREACAELCSSLFERRAAGGFPREASAARSLRDAIRSRGQQ